MGDGPCSGDNLLTKIVTHFLWTKHPGPIVFASVSRFIRRGHCQTSLISLSICTKSVCLSHKIQRRISITLQGNSVDVANLIYSSLVEDELLTCCSTEYDSSWPCLSSTGRRFKGKVSAARAMSFLFLDAYGGTSYTAPGFRGDISKTQCVLLSVGRQ